ncbi:MULTISPECIES: HAD family phosphatase [Variovorax]|uniref:Beta-phosphoglucomutase-like phosphatase (HAD superfamily) n=1 Tax=Variovorax boronicumulans TaxID=436515 RepID=A0A1E7U2V1_9BURK|nr:MULTISPECIES: HAD family phosphatase [Variovorax]ATA56122.1 HAD family phosphatase [Variovorax boronicumulans]MDP9880207.1 beta-phosphoglucomutase-like phosphatase (HAD superfamily) [Variovorax boronicumulans]MDP9910747.1 beta-phosphoglucomutase-like phosphatase (HAD superfamily) [Variovorax boronicumulans]MDP9919629.1 beta-phosphoglucomutase-like phosphatase (HAD superfamily) [Variovorax boronicumulans]MDP9925492.1 beta-phosphoglucomutase-like phosphatase (HAD superfamily) [Variovorax boro
MSLNTGRVEALIFDMDGTMIDSMPWHARSWVTFAQRHGVQLDVSEILARTTGRTGTESMRELFERELSDAECQAMVHEKEEIYRELFHDNFTEVAGFTAFAKAAVARGLKVAVGTAGDRHNIAFAMSRLKMDPLPLAIVGGDEGFSGKPTPAIFLEAARRIGVAPERCIVFEDAPFGIEAARRGGMRAVAVCSTHTAAELAGPHVIAAVRDYNELAHSNFLETLDAASA